MENLGKLIAYLYVKWNEFLLAIKEVIRTILFVLVCAIIGYMLPSLTGCVIEGDGLIIGEIDCEPHTLCEEG